MPEGLGMLSWAGVRTTVVYCKHPMPGLRRRNKASRGPDASPSLSSVWRRVRLKT